MLEIEFQIQRAQLLPRKHAQLMRTLNREVMERQAKRLPNHFEEAAYHLYSARARTPDYVKSKQRRFGHNKPNVKTGRTKQAVMSRIKITATQYGATLKTRGSPESKLQDWQKREITVISRAEIAEERKRQASEYRQLAMSPKYARKRKKRVK